MPFTISREGMIQQAYVDPIGKWTICAGHTEGVKPGQHATISECKKYYVKDMTKAMMYVAKTTPRTLENFNALKASGDFVFNAPGWWVGSPMALHFSKGEWKEGCNSFSGYIVNGSFNRAQPRMECTRKGSGRGYWCKLPGLVAAREKERAICLGEE